MILPLLKCPVGCIIGSTHNAWQEVFLLRQEEVGGELCLGGGCGVVTMETMSNYSYYSLYTEVHKNEILCCFFFFLTPNKHLQSLSLPPSEHLPPVTCQRWRLLRLFSLCPPFLKLQGWGNRSRKIRWWGGHRASSSWKMLLLPSDPAVLFPCRALKLLKLTYYLLDWANMFVFCVHVCASACSPPFFLSF